MKTTESSLQVKPTMIPEGRQLGQGSCMALIIGTGNTQDLGREGERWVAILQ